MSGDSKKIVQEIGETFKRIVREADDAVKKAVPLDRELSKKIHRVREEGQEVVKHISERSEK